MRLGGVFLFLLLGFRATSCPHPREPLSFLRTGRGEVSLRTACLVCGEVTQWMPLAGELRASGCSAPSSSSSSCLLPPSPSCFLPAGLLLFFFPFLRLSFQVFVINLYFVKGFCCTRFCILTESDWLLFSSPKSGFYSQHLSPSCPVTVLVLAPSISNVQTVLANQHQVYLMFR